MTEAPLTLLFAGRVELWAVVEAVLEGRLGQATAVGDAARLTIGCYEIFGGDPSSPSARDLVASATRSRELVYGNDPAWRRLILDVLDGEVSDRPMLDYDPSGIDQDWLTRLEATLPPDFLMQPFDAGLARPARRRPGAACVAGVRERGGVPGARFRLRRGPWRRSGLRRDVLYRLLAFRRGGDRHARMKRK
jgi:hypothetical protein